MLLDNLQTYKKLIKEITLAFELLGHLILKMVCMEVKEVMIGESYIETKETIIVLQLCMAS